MSEAQTQVAIAPHEALATAQADAATAYRNLASFRIEIALRDDGWHIDYELPNLKMTGGGPHYVIDAETGEILSKRYEQ